jgi:phosphate-selective porin
VAAAENRHNPSTFKERRTRIILSGQVFNDFNFWIEPELSFGGVGPQPQTGVNANNTGGARLEAGWLSYTYAPWAKVKVGQFRDMFSLEMATPSQDLDFAERAVITRALAPDLQLGVMVSGNHTLPIMNIPVYYSAGIFNGCGRIDQCPGGIDNDGDKEFTGRFALSPPMPWGNLTIGLNADHRAFRMTGTGNTKGATDVNGVTTPVINSDNHRFNPVQATGWTLAGFGDASQGSLQNGFLINGNRVTGGGDIVWDFYPFMIKGEYLYASQERDALGAGGKNLDNLIMQGGYGTIGYWVFGNKRGGLQAIGRYEHMRVDDRRGEFDPASGTVEKPMEMRSGTIGLNWYVNPSVRLRANYILTDVRPHVNMIGVSNNTRGELTHEGIAEVQLLF